jgi:SAM-dependent methyltransferase
MKAGPRTYRPATVLQWDVRSWSPALRYWERTLGERTFDRGLELGARDGGVSLWLSDRCREVLCSDRANVEELAGPLHRSHGIANIRYETIDARAIPYRGAFDIIVFKSVIGALAGRGGSGKADQQRAFDEIHAALKPGGILLFAENLAASALHRSLRTRFNRWSGNWRYPSLAELREFTSVFDEVELRTTGVIGAFGRSERQRSLLSLADQAVLNAAAPADWKYIAYGSAVKGPAVSPG